jgi:hypothetical protein
MNSSHQSEDNGNEHNEAGDHRKANFLPRKIRESSIARVTLCG